MRRGHPVVETNDEAMAEAYQAGSSLREIAAFYQIGTTTVYRRLKALRVPMRRPNDSHYQVAA